jgi:hypothetical protein
VRARPFRFPPRRLKSRATKARSLPSQAAVREGGLRVVQAVTSVAWGPRKAETRSSDGSGGYPRMGLAWYDAGGNVRVARTACSSLALEIGLQVISPSPQVHFAARRAVVNTPAARTVAERPSPATWGCGQIAAPGLRASPWIGPQDSAGLSSEVR